MKINIITGLFLSLSSLLSFAETLPPSQSICLESAVNEIIEISSEDLHLVRDPRTSLIAKLVNLDTQESFVLAFISANKGIEFISFENETHLYNIWAQQTSSGICEVIEVRVESIN